jgi:hypothetical protein
MGVLLVAFSKNTDGMSSSCGFARTTPDENALDLR